MFAIYSSYLFFLLIDYRHLFYNDIFSIDDNLYCNIYYSLLDFNLEEISLVQEIKNLEEISLVQEVFGLPFRLAWYKKFLDFPLD